MRIDSNFIIGARTNDDESVLINKKYKNLIEMFEYQFEFFAYESQSFFSANLSYMYSLNSPAHLECVLIGHFV